ncbi:MAG TPA: zinc ribbon domain-containing protein, partial [Opitutaceae bacterium]
MEARGARLGARHMKVEPAFDAGDVALELGRRVHGRCLLGRKPRPGQAARQRPCGTTSSPIAKPTLYRPADSAMPTYEYACPKCGHQFEQFQSMRDEPLKKCPKCGKTGVKRLIGGGAGLIFKGSGFYI